MQNIGRKTKTLKAEERTMIMFRNLEAEQARLGLSNESMAEYLGISRVAYENKKKTGKFKYIEIKKLLLLCNSQFEYLFAETKETA